METAEIHLDEADKFTPYFINQEIKRRDIISKEHKYSNFPKFTEPVAYIGEQNLHLMYKSFEPTPNMGYHINQFCMYDTEMTAKQIPEKQMGTIRICTYNVHNWVKPCVIKRIDGEYKYENDLTENKKDHIKPINLVCRDIKADIVTLQELVPIFSIKDGVEQNPYTDKEIEKGSLEPIFKLFGHYGLSHGTIADSFYISNSIDRYYFLGNGIFSKYEFKNKIYHKLGFNRIAIETEVNIFGADIVLICVHTSVYQPEIEPNLTELNKIINLIYERNKFIIVCGDFNKNLYGYKKQIFDRVFFINSEGPGVTTMNHDEPIDHILTSKEFSETFSISNYTSIPSNLSDHNPVIMDIKPKILVGGGTDFNNYMKMKKKYIDLKTNFFNYYK